MRSFILLPTYWSAVNAEESSSLIQLRLHREDAQAKAEPTAEEVGYGTEHVCGAWGDWGECSAICGGGLQTRTYKFIDGNKCIDGVATTCDHGDGDKEQKPCNIAPCPVDCEGSWGEYSDCSATCGGGTQTRMFSVTREANHGGKECPQACGAEELHDCSTEQCENDCLGHWDDWTVCHHGLSAPLLASGEPCGLGGKQNRTYIVDVPASTNGCPCDKSAPTEQTCDLPCCPEPCEGSWSEWGECQGENLDTYLKEVEGGYGETESACCYDTTKGGKGETTRVFTVTKPKVCGGECCEAGDGAEETDECCETPCPIPCVGHFEPPCECSKSCKAGTQTEIFVVDSPAQYGGDTCLERYGYADGDSKTYACNEDIDCPVDCEGDWSAWGKCSSECQHAPMAGEPSPKGTHERQFIVKVAAAHGGEECDLEGTKEVIPCGPPALEEKPGCNSSTGCPIPGTCKWGKWSECSKQCRDSADEYVFRTRKWIQDKAPKCGADNCLGDPPAYEPEEEACDLDRVPMCPVPCIGSWSEFETCTAKLSSPGGFHCGGGSKTRTFIVTQPAAHGGPDCCNKHGEKDSQPCGDRCCEVPCIGEWSAWGECCSTCGGGTRSRVFEISQPSACNGTVCSKADGTRLLDNHKEVEKCNVDPCPIDCVGEWSDFGECSQTCTDCQSYGSVGSKSKSFTIKIKAQHGGKECKWEHGAVETVDCNDKCCPVPCVGGWEEFSDCSSSCGNGVKERTYRISQPALYGGKECDRCDNSTHSVACNLGACPVPCQGMYTPFSSCSAECGGGTKTKFFMVLQPAQNGGDACPAEQGAPTTEECNTHECIAPCLGGFGQWTKCSKPCGGGKKNRTYTVRQPVQGAMMVGGKNILDCPKPDGHVEEVACNTHTCPAGYVCSGNCD